jgi:hypothetical protein
MARDGTTGLEGLQRSDSPGLTVVTLTRESCQEHYVTAVPEGNESLEALLQRAAVDVGDRNAQILSQEVFGMSDKDKTSVSAYAGPRALQGAHGGR